MNQSFYVDSCIYLNLWQKEVESFVKKPLWKIAKNFFEKIEKQNLTIYYSGFLLKELKFILTEEEFKKKKKLFESSPNFKRIFLSEKEFNLAQKIEKKLNYEISFYDILHMLLAKKTNYILITRDKKLLKYSKKYLIKLKKPEKL